MANISTSKLVQLCGYFEDFHFLVPVIDECSSMTVLTPDQLSTLYDKGVSLSYLLGKSNEMFNREECGKRLRKIQQQRQEQSLTTILSHHSISLCNTAHGEHSLALPQA